MGRIKESIQSAASFVKKNDIIDKLNSEFIKITSRTSQIKENIYEKLLNTGFLESRAFKVSVDVLDKFKSAKFEYKAVAATSFAVVLAFTMAFVPVAEKGQNYNMQATSMAKKSTAPDKDQYLISIGGEVVLAVATEEDAKAVFEGIKYYYLNGKPDDPTAEISFDREFRWDLYNASKVGGEEAWEMTPVDAVNYILKGKGETKVHNVVGGDTLWDIAMANSTTVDELLSMNPGLTEDNLKIGMQINLTSFEPYMYVTTVQEEKMQESIPYETVYQDTADLFRGQTKVSKPGQNGSRDVVKKITRINGMFASEQVLSETILSQPQTQVALKGTKSPSYDVVASVDTAKNGILGYPMAHIEVSSPFGVNRGSYRHIGVDLRNPVGTPIVAAEAGTVVFASNYGTYGNFVKIDHGGGLQTCYAHCDKLLVTAGMQVVRGQTIATVGLTGYTTGAHCHFEVRQNGVPQNPFNYL